MHVHSKSAPSIWVAIPGNGLNVRASVISKMEKKFFMFLLIKSININRLMIILL